MSEYPHWPVTILPDIARALTIVDEGSVIRTQMDTGRARQIPRFTEAPIFARVRLQLTTRQKEIFESFKYYRLARGSGWFYLPFPTSTEMESKLVRIMNGAHTTSFEDPLWVITMTLEMKPETPITEDELKNLIDNPPQTSNHPGIK